MNMQIKCAPARPEVTTTVDGLYYWCQLVDITPLSAAVTCVRLRVPGNYPLPKAGQYVELVLPDGTARPFSIANRMTEEALLELHIEARPDSQSLTAILAQLETDRAIQAKLASGNVKLRPSQNSQLFLAAGNGFSQIKALIEATLQNQSTRTPLYLYWGTDTAEQRYMESTINDWCLQYNNLHYRPLNWSDGGSWESAVINERVHIPRCEVYASGSPQRVFQALDALVQKGLPESQFQSDVFAYATPPRKAGKI